MDDTRREQTILNFDEFKREYGVRITNIGVTCPECGKAWGFKITNEKTELDIKQERMICFDCAIKNKKKDIV